MSLNQDEIKQISEIQKVYYMPVIIDRLEAHFKEKGIIETFNFLHEVLINSRDDVETLINQRVIDGEIRDASQARKSVVGNAFSRCLVYTFLKAKEAGLVDDRVFITTSTKRKFLKNM